MECIRANSKKNTVEGKLTNNRIRGYERRENPIQCSEHESKTKMPEMETRMKMGTTG
jgi:hypothetical protein